MDQQKIERIMSRLIKAAKSGGSNENIQAAMAGEELDREEMAAIQRELNQIIIRGRTINHPKSRNEL